MTMFQMIQTTGALSGLACLMLALYATKKQLKAFAKR